MKKTFKRIVTAILIVTMIFGTVATSALASTAGAGDTASSSTSGSGTSGGTGSSSTVGDTLDTGWCEITYDEKGLTVTLNPDVKSLLDVDKAEIKAIFDILVDAAKELVINDLKDQILGDYEIEGDDSIDVGGVTKDNVWNTALDAYITSKYGDASADSYIAFLKGVLADETVADGFIDYALRTLRTAVAAGIIAADDLPEADGLEDTIATMLETELDEHIEAKIAGYVNTYIDWLLSKETGAPDIDADILAIIEKEVETYISDLVESYMDGTLDTAETTDKMVSDYIDSYIDTQMVTVLKEAIENYANGKSNTKYPQLDTLIESKIDEYIVTYIEENIDSYLQDYVDKGLPKADQDGHFVVNSKQPYATITSTILGKINGWMDDVIDAWPYAPTNPDDNPIWTYAHDQIDELIIIEVEKLVEQYFDGTLTNASVEAEIIEQLNLIIPDEIHTIVEKYWAYLETGKAAGEAEPAWFATVHEKVEEFIKTEVREELFNEIKAENPTLSDDEINDLVDEKFDEVYAEVWADPAKLHTDYYDANAEADLIADLLASPDLKVFEADIWHSLSAVAVENELDQVDIIHAIEEGLTDTPEKHAILEDMINEIWDGEDVYEGKVHSLIWESAAEHVDEFKSILKSVIESDIANYKDDDETTTSPIIDNFLANNELKLDALKKVIEDDDKFDSIINTAISASKDQNGEFLPEYQDIINAEINKLIAQGEVIATLRDMLGKITDEQQLASIKSLITEKAKAVVNSKNTAVLDQAFVEVIGITYAEYQTKVDELIAKFIEAYKVEREELIKEPPTLELQDLIGYLQSVVVNDRVIFGAGEYGTEIKTDAIKLLLGDLPKPEEIAVMENEDMRLSWTVTVTTDFGIIEFTLTGIVGGGYDRIRQVARIISNNIKFSVNADGTLVLDVNVPDEFAKLVLKAANTDKIPDNLKQKVFAAFSKTPDDAVALINSFTFDELMQLLEKVDFDRILDSEYVSRFEKLDGLTDEQIKAKIAQYEEQYNKLLAFANRLYNEKIPPEFADLKTSTILDFYNGSGEFNYANSYTVNVEEVLTKISEKYGTLIASFVDEYEITAKFDLTVTFEKINHIEYVIDGETHREGFLPAGADIEYFSGITEYNGQTIFAWADDTGAVYTEMPEKDVVLYAIFDSADAFVKGAVDKTYDGTSSTLEVVVVYQGANPVYTYQWYKDGVAIDGATAQTLDVKNVLDSGSYHCVVSVVDGVYSKDIVTAPVTVAIAKALFDLNDIVWSEGFVYDKTAHAPTISGIPEELAGNITLDVVAQIDAGTYEAIINTTPNDNYDYSSDSLTHEWVIEKAKFDTSVIQLEQSKFDDDGTTHTPVLVGIDEIADVISYSGDTSASATGVYTLVVTLGEHKNYYFDPATLQFTWSVGVVTVELDTSNVKLETEKFTYDTTEKVNTILGIPAELSSSDYEVTGTLSATNAGEYTVTVKFLENEFYTFTNDEVVLTWTIEKAVCVISGITLSGTSFTYDGKEKTVEILGLPTDVNYTVSGTLTAVDANTYTVVITFTDSENYTPDVNELTLTWTIGKALFDPSTIKLTDTAFLYDGTVKESLIIGLREGINYEFVEGSVCRATEVGTYTVTIKLLESPNYEYTIEETTVVLKWTISKQEIDVSGVTLDNTGFTYDGEEKTVNLVGIPEEMEYEITADSVLSATNAGTYTVTVNFLATEFYAPSVDSLTFEWTIEKAAFDSSSVTLDENYFTYDGTVKAPKILGIIDGIEYVVSEDSVKAAILAGNYTIVITLSSDNYEIDNDTLTFEWSIEQATVSTAGVKLSATSFTYDGTKKTPTILGIPEELEYTISASSVLSATNAGKYKIVISFTSDNYLIDNPIVTLNWSIAKAAVSTSGVKLDVDSFVYDGTEKTPVITGLPEELEYTISDDSVLSATEKGEYTITVVFADDSNYSIDNKTVVLTWSIIKKTVTLTWVNNGPFTYSGTAYEVYLVDAEGNKVDYVTYVNDAVNCNTATNAGTYVAKATLNLENADFDVVFDETYEWSINRAVYDMSGVTFENVEVNYDGKIHTITISGTLPEGVTVSYTDNEYILVGDYTVTATFTGDSVNYEPIAPMTATLVIKAVGSGDVELEKEFALYDSEGVLIMSITAAGGVPSHYELNGNNITGIYGALISDDVFGEGMAGYVLLAYDVHFSFDGIAQQVTDEFTVKYRLPESLLNTDKDLRVVYIDENGNVTDMNATRDGEYMVYNTTHFSIYAIAEVDVAPDAGDGSDLTWLWILLIILLILIIIAIIIIIVLKKRKNDGDPEEEAEEPAPEGPAPADDSAEESAEPEAEETAEAEEPAPEAEQPEEPENPNEDSVEEAAEVSAESSNETESVAEAEPEVVPVVVVANSSDDEDGDVGMRIIDGKAVPVRYRSSYMSRLIQSEPPIQDYYTVVKNTLLSYKGVKARMSWNYESFNKGRIQCAKLNVKGKNFVVYLALDPKEYNAGKYHFTDVSDKPKLDKVPMMLKVKSERGLKYAIELIEEMMNKLNMERGDMPNVDYHMPYETTEALVDKDLVKVILPAGMSLDDVSSMVKVDVSEHIGNATSEKTDSDVTIVIEEETASELPDEPVFVDAVEADELVSDEVAETFIEHIEKPKYEAESEGQLCEINLDTICENFENGDVVTLKALKEKHLANKNAGRVKVLARGVMTKSLTVYADKYSLQAVKMITLAGGHAEQYD